MVCEGAVLWKGRREPERLGGRACVEELAVIHVVSGSLPVEAQFEERLAGERGNQEAVWRETEREVPSQTRAWLVQGCILFSFSSCLSSFFFVVNQAKS